MSGNPSGAEPACFLACRPCRNLLQCSLPSAPLGHESNLEYVLDDESEIHPLDRDYSKPVDLPPEQSGYDPKIRLMGFAGIVAGFVTILISAIMVGAGRGSTALESFGSTLHRFGMILILVGAVLVIVAYRIMQLKQAKSLIGGNVKLRRGSFGILVVVNIVAFLVYTLLIYLSQELGSGTTSYLLFNGVLTLTFAMLLTVAVQHKGFIRAFAVGTLSALVINSFFMLAGRGAIYGLDYTLFLIGQTLLIQVTGLICAGYVYILEGVNDRDKDDMYRDAVNQAMWPDRDPE